MIKQSLLAVITGLLPGRLSAASCAPREVLAFYYAWYGDPNDNPDWRGVDTERRVIANAPDYPEAGPYNSQDPAITQRQMQQMKAAGITGLIYSWWGIHTYEDNHFTMVIQAAHKAGLKVTVYYEKCASTEHFPNAEAVIRDFEYLMSTYCQAPNWLTADGKKVLFVYTHALEQLPREKWRSIIADLKTRYVNRIMFNVAAQSSRGLDFVDGIHRYALVASLGERAPAAAAAWARLFFPGYLREQANYPVTTLTVYPGYNDTRLNRPKTLDTGRFDGKLYAALWQAAIRAAPDWILITSWNEWHEGTEVEPSLEYGDLYLQLTSRYSREFLLAEVP